MSIDWNNLLWWQGPLIFIITGIVEFTLVGIAAWLWTKAEAP
mgnify:FL=1